MGFFEGLSKKVSETTSSIQETTNKIQRESKCKKTISDNNAKVEKIYSELGKKVYENRKIDDSLIAFAHMDVELLNDGPVTIILEK